MPCEARFCTTSLAKRPKRSTSQPRSLLVITMLQCKTGPCARCWSGEGFGIATGGARQYLRPDMLSPQLYAGKGGWGHCVLKHTAGQLSDEGGGVQCRLPRIIPTNKLDTNTCQNVVKHAGEHSNGEAASMLFDIGCGCSIPLVLCVELHSTLGRRASGHWSSKLPRDDRHNPD